MAAVLIMSDSNQRSLAFLFIWFIQSKVAVRMVHLVFVVLRDEEGYGALAGGCRAICMRALSKSNSFLGHSFASYMLRLSVVIFSCFV